MPMPEQSDAANEKARAKIRQAGIDAAAAEKARNEQPTPISPVVWYDDERDAVAAQLTGGLGTKDFRPKHPSLAELDDIEMGTPSEEVLVGDATDVAAAAEGGDDDLPWSEPAPEASSQPQSDQSSMAPAKD